MGEIGISRKEFLYELRWWEITAIIRGYRRRERTQWLTTRWQTFLIISALGGIKNAHDPQAWFPFPWEKADINEMLPTDDEINEMRRQIQQENKRRKEEKNSSQ